MEKSAPGFCGIWGGAGKAERGSAADWPDGMRYTMDGRSIRTGCGLQWMAGAACREGVYMNEAIETMLARRSVRAYRSQQIQREELDVILQCALYAPTGGNLQNSRFLVIQDPELMEELNEVIRRELASREIVEGEMMAKGIRRARQDGYHFIFHAPTLISATAPRDHSNSMANCCTGLENIQLAATALGLGACWSNQPHWLTGVPKVRELFGRLGLREDEDIFGSVSVGYPAFVAAKAAARKDGRIILDRDIPGIGGKSCI